VFCETTGIPELQATHTKISFNESIRVCQEVHLLLRAMAFITSPSGLSRRLLFKRVSLLPQQRQKSSTTQAFQKWLIAAATGNSNVSAAQGTGNSTLLRALRKTKQVVLKGHHTTLHHASGQRDGNVRLVGVSSLSLRTTRKEQGAMPKRR
jgi:hypothetical protein